MKVASLLLLVVATSCSHKKADWTDRVDPSKPQFTIEAADLAAPPVLATNGTPSSGNVTIVLQLQFGGEKVEAFREFTRANKNQQIQLVVHSKVVAQPTILAEIPDGRAVMAFSSLAEAQEVRNWLSTR